MNDEQRMLADMAQDLFASLTSNPAAEDRWGDLEDVALDGLLLDAELGGSGGSWEDALIVFRLAGYHALPLPLPEATIASALAGRTGCRGTIASKASGSLVGDRFHGNVSGICQAKGAAYVVAPCPDGGSMLLESADLQFEAGSSAAGEPRDLAAVNGITVKRLDGDVFAMGALARVAQIAGALDAALARSVEYANERNQFGRALGKFQAVQQSLATFACEAAAINCAAMGAAQAMDRGQAAFEIAAAKLRANRAVGIGTAVAHQVHGAIGFTQEYPLQELTRRLWTWRSEFGNDAFWSDALGPLIVERGPENFWADLTARDQ